MGGGVCVSGAVCASATFGITLTMHMGFAHVAAAAAAATAAAAAVARVTTAAATAAAAVPALHWQQRSIRAAHTATAKAAQATRQTAAAAAKQGVCVKAGVVPTFGCNSFVLRRHTPLGPLGPSKTQPRWTHVTWSHVTFSTTVCPTHTHTPSLKAHTQAQTAKPPHQPPLLRHHALDAVAAGARPVVHRSPSHATV